MIVTDHHELGASLPDATAVINPKLLDSRDHPLADLPGVGVAYKLAEALYERARRPGDATRHLRPGRAGHRGRPGAPDAATPATCSSAGWLHCAARSGRAWSRLLEKAELDPTWLSEEHIGFVLGPRLNVAGRLADANTCVDAADDKRHRPRPHPRRRPGGVERPAQAAVQPGAEQGAETQIARDPALLEGGALVPGQPGLARRHHRHRCEPAGGEIWQACCPHLIPAGRGGACLGPVGARGEHHRRADCARRAAGQLRRPPDGRGLRHRPGTDPRAAPRARRTTAAMQADAHVEAGLRIYGILPLAESSRRRTTWAGWRRSVPATRR